MFQLPFPNLFQCLWPAHNSTWEVSDVKERTVHARGHFHGILLGVEEAVCSTKDGGKDTGWALGNTEGASGFSAWDLRKG